MQSELCADVPNNQLIQHSLLPMVPVGSPSETCLPSLCVWWNASNFSAASCTSTDDTTWIPTNAGVSVYSDFRVSSFDFPLHSVLKRVITVLDMRNLAQIPMACTWQVGIRPSSTAVMPCSVL